MLNWRVMNIRSVGYSCNPRQLCWWGVPEPSLPRENALADIGIFPLKGFGRFLVEPDVAQDLPPQVGDGGEDAAIDDVALELAEPAFDLIEPRGVGWCEV